MSAEGNKELVTRYQAEVDEGNTPEIWDEVLAPDIIVHYPASVSPEPLNREAYEQAANQFLSAFPDQRHIIESLVAEGDRVVMRATNRGTHKGAFMGVPPTGKEVSYSVMAEIRIVDGKFVEIWGEVDMLGLLQQVGAVPPLGQSEE